MAARLDWRFLLVDPELDGAAYVGSPDAALLDELRLLCPAVEVLDPGVAHPGAETCGLVIACEPSAAALRFAAGRVSPGGTLVVEVRGLLGLAGPAAKRNRKRRDGSPLRSARGVARRLSAIGFQDVRAHWHWPSFERCTRIVPLEDRTALRYSLSRGGGGTRARIGGWLARALLAVGLLSRMVGSASVIARRAGPASGEPGGGAGTPGHSRGRPRAPVASVVHDFLRAHQDRLGPEWRGASADLSFVVLTPRFRNSSHLIFLLLPQGGAEPVLVTKLPRLAGRSTALEREAALLRQIQASRPGGFESIPRAVAFEPCGDRMILVLNAMPGRAMDRMTVRRGAARCCEAVLGWLLEVQGATRSAPEREGGSPRRSIERDLLEMAALFPAERELFERTRALIEPLGSAGLPAVLEHRDLCHPNLLLGREGRVAVLDWEQAERCGLPALDLFFFLAYVAMALRGAHSGGEAVTALDRAFFGRRSWARAYVDRYARGLGLARQTLTPLFAACWVKQVAGLAQRVARGSDPRLQGAELPEWLRRDWRFAAWRHTVERADRLDWDDLPAGRPGRP